jgi:hypothetical protein
MRRRAFERRDGDEAAATLTPTGERQLLRTRRHSSTIRKHSSDL